MLSSTGPTAEHQGARLGIYQEKGVYNGSKYYEQVHTLNTASKGEFVFRDKDGPWKISDTLGGGAFGTQNLNTTDTLPLEGWQYCDGNKWHDDPNFRVSSVLPSPCGHITISASGEAASKQASCVGVYQPTAMYSAGRRVFKHTSRERYLLVPPGMVIWFVTDNPENPDPITALMVSGCSPSQCPADSRARTSSRVGWTSWRCRDDSWKHGDIQVKCSVHSRK